MNDSTLDLVLFDFRAAFAADAEQALSDLRLILGDPRTCRQRVRWLRHVRAALAGHLVPPPVDSDFVRRPMDLYGLDAADLTGEQVEQLHALSCDPDALEAAHRAVAGPMPPLPTSDSPQTEWTRMAQDADAVPRIVAALAEYVPHWLRLHDLPADLQDEFLAFARSNLPIPVGRRFRDIWPAWLTEFARRHHAAQTFSADELVRQVPRLAFELALDQFASGAAWRQRLVQAVRAGHEIDATALGTDARTAGEGRRELDRAVRTEQFRMSRVLDLLDE